MIFVMLFITTIIQTMPTAACWKVVRWLRPG